MGASWPSYTLQQGARETARITPNTSGLRCGCLRDDLSADHPVLSVLSLARLDMPGPPGGPVVQAGQGSDVLDGPVADLRACSRLRGCAVVGIGAVPVLPGYRCVSGGAAPTA